MLSQIKFEGDHGIVQISKEDYIRAKTKDLREFGYPDLTMEHVRTQLEYVLEGRRPIDVIGHFIEGDKVQY